MNRFCVCGKPIKLSHRLCPACLQEYGRDPGSWPEWLADWQKSYRAELDQERRHMDLEIDADGAIVKPTEYPALRGCRSKTHLYQDRDKH